MQKGNQVAASHSCHVRSLRRRSTKIIRVIHKSLYTFRQLLFGSALFFSVKTSSPRFFRRWRYVVFVSLLVLFVERVNLRWIHCIARTVLAARGVAWRGAAPQITLADVYGVLDGQPDWMASLALRCTAGATRRDATLLDTRAAEHSKWNLQF